MWHTAIDSQTNAFDISQGTFEQRGAVSVDSIFQWASTPLIWTRTQCGSCPQYGWKCDFACTTKVDSRLTLHNRKLTKQNLESLRPCALLWWELCGRLCLATCVWLIQKNDTDMTHLGETDTSSGVLQVESGRDTIDNLLAFTWRLFDLMPPPKIWFGMAWLAWWPDCLLPCKMCSFHWPTQLP